MLRKVFTALSHLFFCMKGESNMNILSTLLLAVMIAVAFVALDRLEKKVMEKLKKKREKRGGNGTAPHE